MHLPFLVKGQLDELNTLLVKQEGLECLFLGSAHDFDSLVLASSQIFERIDATEGDFEHLEFFLVTTDIIATDLDVSVLLMALFAELERHARYLEAFWIYQADHSDCMTAWLKGFPRLTFKMTTRLLKDISARNNVNVPMIGSIKLSNQDTTCPLYALVKACVPNSIVLGAVNGGWIKPFLYDEATLTFEFDYAASATSGTAKSSTSILSPKQGFLLKLNIPHHHAFMFLDPHGKQIQLVHSVYISTIENAFGTSSSSSTTFNTNLPQTVANNLTPQFVRSKRASMPPIRHPSSSLADRSISLSDWNLQEPSFSQDGSSKQHCSSEDSIRKTNKELLKKLLLLSLRRLGIKKDDKQFPTIWKHLYCGCVFALRKELCEDKVDQGILLKTIKDNIKFLNIGQK